MRRRNQYKGVAHHGLDYYLREILECTEESEMSVCETNAVHSAGYLYEDFAAAIRQYLRFSDDCDAKFDAAIRRFKIRMGFGHELEQEPPKNKSERENKYKK